VQGPFRDFQNSVQSMTNAIHAQDINALKTACGQLGSAGHEPGAMLPSLSNAVTAEVNAAVSDIGTSLNNSCTTAGPDTTNLDSVTQPVISAQTHLQSASDQLHQG